MEFEWNEAKARANFDKHGIRFETAATLFLDPNRRTVVDDRFEYGEDRFVTNGVVDGVLIIVVRTQRAGAIRIISARKASRRERAGHVNREIPH